MATIKEIAIGPGGGKVLQVLGVQFATKARTSETRGAYFATEVMLGKDGPPMHVHHNDDEALYVLEGELGIQMGEKKSKLPAGSFHLIPRGEAHTIWGSEKGATRALLLFSPGETQQFMEGADGVTDEAQLGAIAAKHGMEILEP